MALRPKFCSEGEACYDSIRVSGKRSLVLCQPGGGAVVSAGSSSSHLPTQSVLVSVVVSGGRRKQGGRAVSQSHSCVLGFSQWCPVNE